MPKPIVYTAEQLAWVKKHCTLPRREAHAKFVAKFDRPDVKFVHYCSLCKRNGWLTGRTGCYEPGDVPANKGKKMPYNANSAAQRFKKGRQPHNTKNVGDEYVCKKDGYVMLCIAEENPHTGFKHRFVMKHKHLWEQLHGKVPDGHCLKCLDGNKENTDPDNWECLSRAVLLTLNKPGAGGYDTAPDELKPALLTMAKLENKMHSKKKEL